MGERHATRTSYDAIAADYAANLSRELDGKPLDRALLNAFAESCAGGVIADVGAGPGHVAGYLARGGASVVSSDLSPRMCALARDQQGMAAFASDMCALPVQGGALAGVVCLYAVIHLDDASRIRAYAEFARVLRPGGRALISFHTSDAETPQGGAKRAEEMMGHHVELTFRFLDPERETHLLTTAGLVTFARTDRAPYPEVEHPSHRTYLLCTRAGR